MLICLHNKQTFSTLQVRIGWFCNPIDKGIPIAIPLLYIYRITFFYGIK